MQVCDKFHQMILTTYMTETVFVILAVEVWLYNEALYFNHVNLMVFFI